MHGLFPIAISGVLLAEIMAAPCQLSRGLLGLGLACLVWICFVTLVRFTMELDSFSRISNEM